MNTPSHVAASLLLWRQEESPTGVTALVVGAFLPDATMFGFYAYQKLWAGRSEQEIWSTLYFDPKWQLLFDWFNSIPLAALLAGLCWWAGPRWAYLLFASALLHMLCDLPVHHDDAHRHFLPFTNWRFASPVSYWDPNHHGRLFAVSELIFAVASCAFVGWKAEALAMRIAAFGTLGLYVLGIGFATVMWVM